MIREDLRFGRLLAVWAPLGATFLLVTGATPVVNASINRLPARDHAADLAAFAVFLACTIVLHSPLFVTREIAIKMSVDRAGSRRALLFCLNVAFVISAIELLFGLTGLGPWVLRAFAENEAVVQSAHHAFLFIWPVPFFIALRGVYQAHQIRADDTLFVGLGTLVRLGFTGVIGLSIAPHLGIGGPTLGAICITFGIMTETLFAVVRARARARPPAKSDLDAVHPLRFALPLMLANLLGVGSSLFYVRVAGLVPDAAQEASLAAFQEVRSIHWLLTATAFAMQSLTTAKVRGPGDEKPMLRFGTIVGTVLTVLFVLVAWTPLREVLLVDILGEKPDGAVLEFAAPTLMLAAAMPILNAVRFTLRGILIARGSSGGITLSNITTLLLLTSAIAFGIAPFLPNGALNAYTFWTATLIVEIGILWTLVFWTKGEPALLPPPMRTPRESAGG